MNDDELTQLFRTGTAPERDATFAARTNRTLSRHRQIATLLTVVKICGVTMLVVGLFVMTQTLQVMFGVPPDDISLSTTSIALPLLAAAAGSAITILRRHTR